MAARRIALTALALIVLLLAGGIGAGVQWAGWKPTPALALDLEGGTQVILQAKSIEGQPVDRTSMEQARQIMSQRINAMGVSETEISIQGGSNIVVDVPGKMDQQTSDALRQTAAMSFRPVLAATDPKPASDGGGAEKDAVSDSGEQDADPSQQTFSGAVAPNPEGDPSKPAATGADGDLNGGLKYPAWSDQWITSDVQKTFLKADCTKPRAVQKAAQDAPADEPITICDADGSQKYLLGPEVVAGKQIKSASVGSEMTPTGQPTGAYAVNMSMKPQGAEKFATMTTALHGGQGMTGAFAIVLDDQVISAPQVQEPSSNGEAQITGGFTEEEASTLADQLKFGALPLEFDVQSEQQISATLGTDQLQKGLVAGLIGLALVVLYACFQYRVLAIVTTSSLVIMGALAYGVITAMSNIPDIGYRLSLAGVAGLIVSIAFTADSFIVYFERVKDEIRDGRGIVAAVDHGWSRARRTILASDTVNVIAAVVLYILSTGGVRGFAFTLGLCTLLDIAVVFLFTHPLLQSLARTRFFGQGHPWSGLDPAALDRDVPAYAGRGRIRTGRRKGSSGDAPETLAERKARLRREAAEAEQRPGTETGPDGEDES